MEPEMTAREDVEKLLVVWALQIQQDTPPRAPSHWRKTLKLWAAVMLAYTLAWIVIGIGAGIVERVWP
jgi:high-affinity Fe2+/Pb2+ permease